MKDVCKYPVIFVHGMFGWGDDEGINNYLPYWGANTCNIIKHYNESGFETHAASVGPASSAWDRACELYARLTGNVVDYGKVHSERCNHKRYGRYYSTPLISNWDSDFFIYNLRYLVSLLYHTQPPITTKIPQLGIIPCCGCKFLSGGAKLTIGCALVHTLFHHTPPSKKIQFHAHSHYRIDFSFFYIQK